MHFASNVTLSNLLTRLASLPVEWRTINWRVQIVYPSEFRKYFRMPEKKKAQKIPACISRYAAVTASMLCGHIWQNELYDCCYHNRIVLSRHSPISESEALDTKFLSELFALLSHRKTNWDCVGFLSFINFVLPYFKPITKSSNYCNHVITLDSHLEIALIVQSRLS